jgi:hypothetical protein
MSYPRTQASVPFAIAHFFVAASSSWDANGLSGRAKLWGHFAGRQPLYVRRGTAISRLISFLPELVELEKDRNAARSRRKPQPLRIKPVTIGDLARDSKLLEFECSACRPARHLYIEPLSLGLPKNAPPWVVQLHSRLARRTEPTEARVFSATAAPHSSTPASLPRASSAWSPARR